MSYPDYRELLRVNLQRLRKEKGWSVADLEARTGMPCRQHAHKQSEHKRPVGISTRILCRYAGAFGLEDPLDLLRERD